MHFGEEGAVAHLGDEELATLITLLEMAGADLKQGKFVLAEGADGSSMTRTIPMSLIAAIRPDVAIAMARGAGAYLNAIPEPLYALFGTGYLGYTAARAWGKAKGVER